MVNELKYTSLTNDDILKQVYDRFLKTTDGSTNHKFDNFRESAIAQTLMEVFAGVTDINNYYIQRRAEECYFDTAQLKSSVISLSRMFGYVMNRKEPSHAKVKMVIEGNIEDSQVQIPNYSKFSYAGDEYVLVNTMTYRMSSDEYNLMDDDSVITIGSDSFGNDIEIVQGTIKEKVFPGTTNAQANAPFQIYKIDDKSFSNVYGDKDFFYKDVTQVYVGEKKIPTGETGSTQFSIDRRSLLNWETIYNSNLTEPQSICVLRTTPDGGMELLFGDGTPDTTNTVSSTNATGGFSRKGAITNKDNIYVQYLSCEGSSTNTTGVIGDKVDFSGKIYNSNGTDITSKISFMLTSNVYGGADDESMESIKYSSPKIYYSLDRLVAKGDYIAYLKSLNTPVNVQNAVVWGEQEERDLAKSFALVKMFNVALFSLTGSLYNLDASPHVAKIGDAYDDVVLDLNYDPYEFQNQGYFNIFVIQQMVNQLNRYNVISTFYEIDSDPFIVADTYTTAEQRIIAIASNFESAILANYTNGDIPITFTYTSGDKSNVSNITATGTVNVNGADLKKLSTLNYTGKLYMDKVADLVNTALLEFKDVRGNKTDNSNFNKEAFYGRYGSSTPLALLYWDSVDAGSNGYSYKYVMRFNESLINSNESVSPCYITSIDSSEASLMGAMNLAGETPIQVTTNSKKDEMNGNISTVVSDLTKRSQVNVKNIYVSPIIHRFILSGDIYIKSLYDRNSVRAEITNSIYEWLDLNADFNKPLYISDINKLITSHNGVIHANVKLVPEDITAGENNTSNKYYDSNPMSNDIYEKYNDVDDDGNKSNLIAEKVNDALYAYLKPTNTKANDDWYRNMFANNYTLSASGSYIETAQSQAVESKVHTLNNDISERTFYSFAGKLYTELKKLADTSSTNGTTAVTDHIPNYGRFIGLIDNDPLQTYKSDVLHSTVVGSDFSVVMEQIHKDLSYSIMNNMLDTTGNIDNEYNTDNQFKRGGYTLGSEIVQVLLEKTYSNSKNETQSFLQVKYK